MDINIKNELKEIILCHISQYPKMQPSDVCKLLYQGEFGGGHLIKDRDSCLKRISDEINNFVYDKPLQKYEDIGFGFVRLNICTLNCDAELICNAFVESSDEVCGSKVNFISRLEYVRDTFGEYGFGFALDNFNCYLDEYITAGCPVVSHSDVYRNSYHPAYRVMKREYAEKLI